VVEQMIGVNVTGAAATLCAVLPKMVERNRGHLVGVSSIAAYRGMSLMAGYSASKAYLATFCESLRVDLARTNVAVSAIHPGYIKSEMTANNTFWMPFLMETDAAVEGIGRAILREAREFVIPWQWRPTMRALRMVPNAAWDGLARKLR
jgi:short-subunit dehydrogenase